MELHAPTHRLLTALNQFFHFDADHVEFNAFNVHLHLVYIVAPRNIEEKLEKFRRKLRDLTGLNLPLKMLASFSR